MTNGPFLFSPYPAAYCATLCTTRNWTDQTSTEQAEVVVLRIWEGMTFAEIGEVLEISQNTAASRYQYAMQKLSRRLAPIRTEAYHD